MFSAATHRLITLPLAKYLDARLFGMHMPCVRAPYMLTCIQL